MFRLCSFSLIVFIDAFEIKQLIILTLGGRIVLFSLYLLVKNKSFCKSVLRVNIMGCLWKDNWGNENENCGFSTLGSVKILSRMLFNICCCLCGLLKYTIQSNTIFLLQNVELLNKICMLCIILYPLIDFMFDISMWFMSLQEALAFWLYSFSLLLWVMVLWLYSIHWYVWLLVFTLLFLRSSSQIWILSCENFT